MQLAAMTNYNQVNLLDKKKIQQGQNSKEKTQPKRKKNLEGGHEVTKKKNLDRLTNLNLGVGDVVVYLMITSRNV